MGTSAEAAIWRTVDSVEQQASQFEALLTQRQLEAKLALQQRLAQLEAARDEQTTRLATLTDNLARSKNVLARQRASVARGVQPFGLSVLRTLWRGLLLFALGWVTLSIDSLPWLPLAVVPAVTMWVAFMLPEGTR